jgi:carboxymethylenebutenolidase
MSGVDSEVIARSVGDSLLVDEFIMRMTHDRDVTFPLRGLAPTGKPVEYQRSSS